MELTKRYRATGLQEAILEKGLRRDWVAAQARVHPSLITHLLAGRRTVSDEVAQRVAAALQTPIFWLFELTSGSEMQSESVEDREVAVA